MTIDIIYIKSLHLIFMVTWFSGLFYLPRLYVYHAMSSDSVGLARFKVMERKLYYGITYPGGVLTSFFGAWIVYANPEILLQPWMQLKLVFLSMLWFYHLLCGRYLRDFKHDNNNKTHVFYRWFNEFPVIVLVVVMLLAKIKPIFVFY